MTSPEISHAFERALQYQSAGQLSGAEQIYRKILQQDPLQSVVYYNLGILLKRQGRVADAIECFREALDLNPIFPEAVNNLGTTLQSSGQLDEAIELFRRCIELKPDFADAYNNLGGALKDRGDIEGAVGAITQAVKLTPKNPVFRSNLIYTLHYLTTATAADILYAAKEWNAPQSDKPQFTTTSAPPRLVGPRLRIGYISPYFRAHGQSLFLVPLLAHHNHAFFEITVYSDDTCRDEVTAQLQTYTDRWRNIAGLSTPDIAALIQRDQIDILIDLGLHTARNYLPVFALKPAPLQMTWLGYPGTTGLSQIDIRLTDPWLDPHSQNGEAYSERSIRLPETFWCYDPLTTEPAVNALPAFSTHRITFGCLNNFCKVNDLTLAAWARVLEAVPTSRMYLMAPPGTARERVRVKLRIDPSRIEFVEFAPRDRYLERYQKIDLCLDTFPYNGHTTSLDALWMGVPVVTRRGETAVSRAGECFLANLDLRDLVADSTERFVEIAAALARNRERLADLRQNLRTRMEHSPLMDAPRFACNIEHVFRTEWERASR